MLNSAAFLRASVLRSTKVNSTSFPSSAILFARAIPPIPVPLQISTILTLSLSRTSLIQSCAAITARSFNDSSYLFLPLLLRISSGHLNNSYILSRLSALELIRNR
ncbi:MAG: hypothetical protein C0200_04780 [Thermoproteota archaeon]|nr:MAG: hypothetical protein C0200_04780 [Candidatus Korarchaeota archaeon]